MGDMSEHFSADTADALIKVLHAAEQLKCELRHSFTSSNRQESVAEHCWRAALLALLLRPYIQGSCDAIRLVDLLLVHDLCEVYAGDTPIFATLEDCPEKKAAEDEAIARLIRCLPTALSAHIRCLWEEYVSGATVEAKIAHAIDKLEAQLQHNEAGVDTWTKWEKERVFSGFAKIGIFHEVLSLVRDVIISEAVEKLKNHEIVGSEPLDAANVPTRSRVDESVL
jgi:putative hydrolase of HD superfamily